MRIVTPDIALTRLAAACARTEICSSDAREKLRRWGIMSGDAAKILDRLTDEGYISDERFARAYVRDKYRFAGWGRRKIAMGLAAKRIGRGIAADALRDSVDPDEYRARLTAVVRTKARSLPQELHHTYEGKQKLYVFAAGRGYESDLISSVINSKDDEIWPDEAMNN